VLAPLDGVWEFGASGVVYQPEILLRTLAILQENPPESREWNLPSDFRSLVEKCYRRDAALGALAADPGFSEALGKGIEKRDEFQRGAVSEAQNHLWIAPSPKIFEPVARNQDEPDEEGSGPTQKYFVARTRLGDESAAVLAIGNAALLNIARTDLENARLPRAEQKSPHRHDLQQIFGCKSGVPRWWLFDRKTGAAHPSLEGFVPFFKGGSFLRGHVVLPLQERNGEMVWHGQDSTGRFALVDHPKLGLLRRPLDDLTAAQTPLEADAGAMS
jgi:hypothetical protein